jgi:uncharacterized protein with PIN domain
MVAFQDAEGFAEQMRLAEVLRLLGLDAVVSSELADDC